MASVVSSLNDEREKRLRDFFSKPVRLHLLYTSSVHRADVPTLLSKFDGGAYILALFLPSGSVRGGYTTKSLNYRNEYADEHAFVFEINEDAARRFRVLDAAKAVAIGSAPGISASRDTVQFGSCLHIHSEKLRWCANFGADATYGTGWCEEKQLAVHVELHRVQELEDVLAIPWREVDWTEKTRDDLRKQLVSCELKLESLSRVKALLLGPVGSGKSSLVNSIRSTMYGRTVHLPIIGSAETAFTQKLTSYDIRAKKRGRPTALSLCDAMGVGEEGSKDLTLSDALAVVRGHVPEGYKFQSEAPITDATSGYRAEPSLNDRVHCVLFVLDASKVESYPDSLCSALRELRTAVSDLGVPQLILLTHVDQVCPIAKEDVKYVYSSRSLQEKMQNAAELVGLPLSFVFPVKNYISQLSVECNADILLLSVVNSVLQAVDDALEDHFPGPIMEFPSEDPVPHIEEQYSDGFMY